MAQTPAATLPSDPRARHPALLALVRRLSEWSPELGARLAAISLVDTGGADEQRTREYLLYLIDRGLLLPTLRLSSDPVLRDLGDRLDEDALFGLSYARAKLGMGDPTPRACTACGSPDCTTSRQCKLELQRLHPAYVSEDGLGFFGDLCQGEHEFPWLPSCELALERYLEATLAAGLGRQRVENVLFDVVRAVAERCRTVEKPPTVDPSHSLEPGQILVQAHARWRAFYAKTLGGDPISADGRIRDVSGDTEAYRAWHRFECQMFREVVATRRYAAELEGYYAVEGTDREPAQAPLIECEVRRTGPAVRLCREVRGGLGVLESVLGDQLLKPNPSTDLAIKLAMALESLSLAGIAPQAIDRAYRRLVGDLTRAASSRPTR
jgi:hypothetical protein